MSDSRVTNPRSIAACLALLGLAGCARAPDASSAQVDSNYYNLPGNNVYEFKLKDGTRCVLSDGTYSGGITCDWSRP